MPTNQNYRTLIETSLKSDERLWNEDRSELNQTLLIDLAENIDEKVIDLLLQDEALRQKFFVKIKDVYVFKTNDFRFFLEDSKVDNSYTKYKNRIGLTDSKRFLKDTNDVVLDFPYKDCVLEGGQSSEEGTDTYFEYDDKSDEYKQKLGKRKEVFFNQVLAHDEIDRLFDPKALTNWKRYTKDGEEEVKEIKRDEDGTIKENLIIKGNNLLALHSLKKQFAGKVKLIYIDPPYNTGNDGFKYNDNFNHSTWLTFMKNRLEIARDLLRDDGVIFVQIDNSPSDLEESPELGYLLVLMDEVFYRKNYIGIQVWKKKGNASNTESNIGTITESILMYAKNFNSISFNLQDYKRNYKYENYGVFYNLEKPIKTNSGAYERTTMLFGIETKEGIFYPPEGKRWTIGEETAKEYVKNKKYKIIDNEFYIKKFPEDYKKGEFKLHNNLLDEHGSLKSAKGELENLGFNRENFDSPKPEKLLQRIIEMSTDVGDIVLDYHLGSGTTCAVAHKMGRQYIGIEQMDYVKTIAVERLKKVIGKAQKSDNLLQNKEITDYDTGGISKAVGWQGGGDFIYFELAKWNETAKERILECENLEELVKFFDQMYDRYFLNYNLKIKEFREKVVNEKEFKDLSLDEQKKIFVAMLDNNQMYVNKTEMEDKKFGISEEDIDLTKQFYNSQS